MPEGIRFSAVTQPSANSADNNGDGNHTITGDQKFGVQVHGYGQYTSDWYPAGLDLNLIPQ